MKQKLNLTQLKPKEMRDMTGGKPYCPCACYYDPYPYVNSAEVGGANRDIIWG
jgi:hypothetical protein